MPKVSVVIPCYNLGAYLDEAVSSVLTQTFADFEIIVVNDGSTDPDTCELLATYSRPKTRVIHTSNRGVSAARNRGVKEASGEYILPLDADDCIAERYLEQAVEILDRYPKVGIIYGDAEYFGIQSGLMPLPSYSPSCMLWTNSIFSAAFFRRTDWKKVGGYCLSMRQGWEDWEFWLSLVELEVEVIRFPEVVLQYRTRTDSRDSSLTLSAKVSLMAVMISNHPKLYLRKGISGLVGLLKRRFCLSCTRRVL